MEIPGIEPPILWLVVRHDDYSAKPTCPLLSREEHRSSTDSKAIHAGWE